MSKKLFSSPDYYDKHGNAKAHILFWICCFFLARAWIVLIGAGISQKQTSDIIEIFYPSQPMLYLGLALGAPAVILMLLAGNLHRYPHMFSYIWRIGKWLLVSSLLLDLGLQLQQLIAQQWLFTWGASVNLLLSLWLICYLLTSHRVKWIFKSDIYRS